MARRKKRKSQFNTKPAVINKEKLEEVVIQIVKAERFSGPLPPPEILKKYNDILPGAAERIFKMTEEQAKHRQELEKKVIDHDVKQSKRGSIFAFLFGLLTITAGFILLLVGKNIEGFVSMFGGLAPILFAFIYQSSKRKRERIQKYEK